MQTLIEGSHTERVPCNDAAAVQAWNDIMAIATKHALVVAAFDGVATLALPSAQREQGWHARCQYNHGLGEHPKTLERNRANNRPPGDDPRYWRLSKSGFSIKTGWADEKKVIAHYPGSAAPLDNQQFQGWLDNAEHICALHNAALMSGV